MNVRSAETGDDHLSPDDRSTRSRIRDAAIECFADAGVKATTVRRIASRAGVSAALVIHHFGSKERLRAACDAHVARMIRERKRQAMRDGPGLDPLAALRQEQHGPPLARYLARTLAEGTPQVARLVDEMIDDAERYMADGVANGSLRQSEHPRGVAAVLTFWSLGALVLHEHVERVLGVDIAAPPHVHADNPAYVAPALELLAHGILAPEWYERLGSADAPRGSEPEEREESR